MDMEFRGTPWQFSTSGIDRERSALRAPELRKRYLLVISAILLWIFACSRSGEDRGLEITVAFSSDLNGVMRSCGCVVNDFGGLGRRATFVRFARDTASRFLLLDGGDLFGTNINYGKEKAEVTMKAMALMGYDGIVLGEKDFSLGLEYIRKRAVENALPVVMANVFDARADTLLFQPSREIVLPGDLKVALIGLMGNRLELPPQVEPGSIRVTDPISALRLELEMLEARVDLVIVLAHMNYVDARKLAMEFPRLDLVLVGHKGSLMKKAKRFGNAFVLQVPGEGRYMGLAYCKLNSEKRIEQLFPRMELLDESYRDDEAVGKLFAAYDMDIVAKERAGIQADLKGGREARKPFAGAQLCRECHEEIYAQWMGTSHAHAFDLLEARTREFDRDCTPCHTTGFYKRGGFVSLASTPHLVHVQCEACHGNGYDHVRDPKLPTTKDPSTVCTDCHNAEQSPAFDFVERWSRIRH